MNNSESYDKERLIRDLYTKDYWSPGLLEELNGFEVNELLSSREFFILEERINNEEKGLSKEDSFKEIASILKTSTDALEHSCQRIKQKLKQGMIVDANRAYKDYKVIIHSAHFCPFCKNELVQHEYKAMRYRVCLACDFRENL